eukprot:GGOE01022350.1.p1 GENE.GGOE01022350.1~~GGOE01022350.1.p1  ORF type:complete len:689 (-),score=181.62 GGOE01022350.1:330-2396(-)
MACPELAIRRPLAPGDKHSHDPKGWLRQRVKPPHLAEWMWLTGEDHSGVLCGYLRKTFWPQVPSKKKDNWHTRWFALDKDRAMLYYYKAAVDPEELQRTHARGWIALSAPGTALVTDPPQLRSSGARRFHIAVPGGKKGGTQVVKFQAPSDEAHREWVTALKEVMGQQPLYGGQDANQSPATAPVLSESPSWMGPGVPPPPPVLASRGLQEVADARLVMFGFSGMILLVAFGGSLGVLLVFAGGNGVIWALANGFGNPLQFSSVVETRRRSQSPPVRQGRRHRGSETPDTSAPSTSMYSPPPPAPTGFSTATAIQAVVFNALVAAVLFGGPLGTLLILLAGDAAIWKTLAVPAKPVSGVSARRMDGNTPCAVAMSDGEGAEGDDFMDEEASRSPAEVRPTPMRARAPLPVPTTPVHVPMQLRHTGGQSLRWQTSPADTNCWAIPDPASFNVRIGPDYARLKQKAPSNGSILTPVAADLFTSDQKVDHVMQHMQFPAVDFEVAHWFVINAQVCNYPPSNPVWGGAKVDGPGMSVVVFNPIPPPLWQQIQRATSGHLELLRRFLTADRLPDPEVVYNRSKLVATLLNADDPALQLNSTCTHLVKSWNSKPVLTRPQHRIIHSDLYTELDINLHEFSYLARRGLAGFIGRVKCMELNVALVLEAQTDAELPEVVLTCFTLNRVDLERGKPW